MDSYCSALWRHLCVRPPSKIQPCCQYLEPLDISYSGSLEKDLNHTKFLKLREKALANEFIEGCKKCYGQEAAGQGSLRMDMNERYKVDFDGIKIKLSDIKTAEIYVGDVCNLKCMMCSPELSTTWREDYEKLGWTLQKRANYDPKIEHEIKELKNLEELKFVGGEPLMSSGHKKVLQAIPDEQARKMVVDYNTNTTIFPDIDTLKIWEKYGQINLWLSIDGFGKVNEFIRFPSKWEQVEASVNEFIKLSQSQSNIELKLICTLSAYNVLDIEKLIEWKNDLGLSSFVFNPVVEPKILSPANLPSELYNKAMEKHLRGNENQKIIGRYLQNNRQEFDEELIEYTQKIAKVRNIELQDYLPELDFL